MRCAGRISEGRLQEPFPSRPNGVISPMPPSLGPWAELGHTSAGHQLCRLPTTPRQAQALNARHSLRLCYRHHPHHRRLETVVLRMLDGLDMPT